MRKQHRIRWKGKAAVFLTSQCITLFGSSLVQMSIVWHATVATSSGAWVAAFYACSFCPQFLVSLLGGVLADRTSRKLLIGCSDAFIALATLAACLLVPQIESEGNLPLLLSLSALRSVGAGVQMPAVSAAIPDLVPSSRLARYNGINATMQASVQFAAPAAAAAVLSFGSLRHVMLIDVATAAVGIAFLALVAMPDKGFRSGGTAVRDLLDGAKCVASNRRIALPMASYAALTILSIPGGYLAGLFVEQEFGGEWAKLAAAEVAGFAGMAFGGIVSSRFDGKEDFAIPAGLAIFGTMSILMATTDALVCYLSLMGAYGIALTVTQTSIITMLQKEAPPSMRGRVFGLANAVYSGFLPLGMAVLGPLADALPLRTIMAGAGIAGLGIALMALRALRGGQRSKLEH